MAGAVQLKRLLAVQTYVHRIELSVLADLARARDAAQLERDRVLAALDGAAPQVASRISLALGNGDRSLRRVRDADQAIARQTERVEREAITARLIAMRCNVRSDEERRELQRRQWAQIIDQVARVWPDRTGQD